MEEKTKKKYKRIVLILLCVCLVIGGFIVYLYFIRANTQFSSTGYVMGSFMQQTIYGKDGENAATEALANATQTEALISWRTEGSDIDKINSSSGKGTTDVSDRTLEILNVCCDVADATNGAFDPCILPLSSLWDFDAENPTVPSSDQINKFLNFVSYKNISISGNSVSLLKEGCGIDLGAAGKGAACDDAIKAYKEHSVKGAVVSVGGSIGVYGSKPDGKKWKIAVRDPNGDVSDSIGVITLASGFISTSGSYEKCFVSDGITYFHILDPSTGYPVKTDIVSVTVVAKTGVASDVLSTACFILGPDGSTELLEKYGAAAIFVDKQNNVTLCGDVDFEITNNSYKLKG